MLLVEVREQNVISYIDAFRHRLINQDIPIILQQDKFDHEGQRVPYSPTKSLTKILSEYKTKKSLGLKIPLVSLN